MSDLATFAKLARSNAQLPVNVYFDEPLYQRELHTLFQQGPRYVGHELMVPETGDYATLPWENEGRMLVRNAHGIELVSNVCRHRQAKMLDGRGNARNIVCPLHRWTYDLKGELIGAPHFGETPCLNLSKTPLQNWNGLLFEANGANVAQQLKHLGVARDLDFSGYLYDHTEVHQCDYNWKTFIEVYLEDYHVEPFHPGLGNFVSCDDLTWEFGRDYSVQTVGVNHGLARSGSPTYAKWQEKLLKFGNGTPPKYGAIWLTLYPNIMVEWYPHVLVVSTLWPNGPQKTTNVVEFYYPEEIALFEREMVEAERAAYMETCIEDDEIALRMDAGRRILLDRGTSEVGPYQSPMEDGMQHFHEWYRTQLEVPAGAQE
ncbi:aromatic ring-hydroxylating dioxygenase subunit alpha [Herbaspirillum sp. SJZ099]|uniref:aromatic ring-hydroxylating oxygenase subunit alpha n=1 Tax=Herbaspirillum sp. SJZ099 TaxID=2572916 RepID=UPI0011A73A3E|nr:aromatic ring-hydroxylating dioxygenase subunit alpha [Herbaspirillum sp. SJZ099]TWC62800.1 phenylpropionate dioxygenase-like ring-hydroxylating dioxygenase large terminal subunit [Herbaspirillum sp. SJZ099]